MSQSIDVVLLSQSLMTPVQGITETLVAVSSLPHSSYLWSGSDIEPKDSTESSQSSIPSLWSLSATPVCLTYSFQAWWPPTPSSCSCCKCWCTLRPVWRFSSHWYSDRQSRPGGSAPDLQAVKLPLGWPEDPCSVHLPATLHDQESQQERWTWSK